MGLFFQVIQFCYFIMRRGERLCALPLSQRGFGAVSCGVNPDLCYHRAGSVPCFCSGTHKGLTRFKTVAKTVFKTAYLAHIIRINQDV